jgi:predicted nucleotidyltransferase
MKIPPGFIPEVSSPDPGTLGAVKQWLGLYGSCSLFTEECRKGIRAVKGTGAGNEAETRAHGPSGSAIAEEPEEYGAGAHSDSPRPEDLLNALLAAAACFNELNVRYVVGGGLSVNLHGQHRATRDVDLFLLGKPEQVAAWLPVLAKRELRPHLLERSSFMPPDAVFWFAPLQYDLVDAPPVDVDLLVADSEFMAFLHASGLETVIDGIRLRVLSAEGLLLLKLRAFRDIDRWDFKRILKVNAAEVDRELLTSWIEKMGLRERLERMEREIKLEGDQRYG